MTSITDLQPQQWRHGEELHPDGWTCKRPLTSRSQSFNLLPLPPICEAPAQKACSGLTQTRPKRTQQPPRPYEEVWDSADTGEGSLTRGSCGAWVDLIEGPGGVERNM
ncbi:hypothetical protein C8J55DRAFT_492958 [Lentinula edodes]|uniref:Uncharacterized protein n=1 Tax=Lentinula lateritia TaxID=40482 RepID=A0A9W8ZTI5_9AGAR|nr:hypothetical protein C8J55DRAFT_492958 [Lentinula edodes]